MESKNIESFFKSLSKEDIIEWNNKEHEKYVKEYDEFMLHYKKWECHICKKSIKSFSSSNICLHSLLRQNKFKKKNFKDIYKKRGYFNISSYLRRWANQENFIKNINDLEEEKWDNKKFEYTIKWKSIDWTLSCSNSDFLWHQWTNSDFPHYHLQMRIDQKPFIDFSDFHIPFSDYDLFLLKGKESGCLKHTRWSWWVWIQEALESLTEIWEDWIDSMNSSRDEDEAQFHFSTIIRWPIKWEVIDEIIQESKKTWKTMTTIARKKLWKDNVQCIVSPAESIHDIAKRK